MQNRIRLRPQASSFVRHWLLPRLIKWTILSVLGLLAYAFWLDVMSPLAKKYPSLAVEDTWYFASLERGEADVFFKTGDELRKEIADVEKKIIATDDNVVRAQLRKVHKGLKRKRCETNIATLKDYIATAEREQHEWCSAGTEAAIRRHIRYAEKGRRAQESQLVELID